LDHPIYKLFQMCTVAHQCRPVSPLGQTTIKKPVSFVDYR